MVGNDIENFLVIGSSFVKADSDTRSRFAVTREQAAQFYAMSRSTALADFFILSTCNRTEFYAVGSRSTLQAFVSRQLQITDKDLNSYFYFYRGLDAIQHFFRVVAGLDSQILGDYEIVCQVKAALEQARANGRVGPLFDRIANFAFQASKKIKVHTQLSSGKYSVSYAASQMMYHRQKEHGISKMLLVGAGDFGASVAHRVRHYFPCAGITLTNRTHEKAIALAAEVKADVIPFHKFSEHLAGYDAVVCTAGSNGYLIDNTHLPVGRPTLLLDLCVPQTIDPAVRLVPGVTLLSVDDVSAFHNELLNHRKMEVPYAQKIVDGFIAQLMTWHRVYVHRGLIHGYKTKIHALWKNHPTWQSQPMNETLEEVFTSLILEIKSDGYAGCRMIAGVNKLVPASPL